MTPEERERQLAQISEPYLQELFTPEWEKYQGYDVRPSTRRPVVVGAERPRLQAMRWGWAKRPFANKDHINARWSDGNPKKMFVSALHERRCVVPATAYYEWERDEKDRPKAKYAFFGRDHHLLRMAGIWENSLIPGSDEREPRFLIFTRDMILHQVLHDRTPVLLSPAATEVWLDQRASEAEIIEASATMADEDLIPVQVIRDAQAEREDSPRLLSPMNERKKNT